VDEDAEGKGQAPDGGYHPEAAGRLEGVVI